VWIDGGTADYAWPMTAETATQPEVTVWFDSDCPLCVREIAFMRRLDRRGAIDFVDIQGSGACPIDRQTLLERFHAREAGQPIVSGAAAFAAMWRAIPVLKPLGIAARSRIVLAALERLYLCFLKVRPWLQRRVSAWESRRPPSDRQRHS